ncbi:hypothetical protein AVEN_240024-1 [Araneus ventricosus]|uniref:Uncharacterized protein n=1 Tax=Araneus ventricosus TaxID=182803 RepID=A0A4Y2KG48_ARAVE|nr:hypothetical protein AVEN_240024-1 [Araneus ventricosus]
MEDPPNDDDENDNDPHVNAPNINPHVRNPEPPQLSPNQITEISILLAVSAAIPPGLTWAKLGQALGRNAPIPINYKNIGWDMIGKGMIYKLGHLIYPTGPLKACEAELLSSLRLPLNQQTALLNFVALYTKVSHLKIHQRFDQEVSDKRILDAELRGLLDEKRLKLDSAALFRRVYSHTEQQYRY